MSQNGNMGIFTALFRIFLLNPLDVRMPFLYMLLKFVRLELSRHEREAGYRIPIVEGRKDYL